MKLTIIVVQARHVYGTTMKTIQINKFCTVIMGQWWAIIFFLSWGIPLFQKRHVLFDRWTVMQAEIASTTTARVISCLQTGPKSNQVWSDKPRNTAQLALSEHKSISKSPTVTFQQGNQKFQACVCVPFTLGVSRLEKKLHNAYLEHVPAFKREMKLQFLVQLGTQESDCLERKELYETVEPETTPNRMDTNDFRALGGTNRSIAIALWFAKGRPQHRNDAGRNETRNWSSEPKSFDRDNSKALIPRNLQREGGCNPDQLNMPPLMGLQKIPEILGLQILINGCLYF